MGARRKIAFGVFDLVVLAILAAVFFLMYSGVSDCKGPFRGLSAEVIAAKYPAEEYQNGIIFYGASNFRLWSTMEEDMAAFGYEVSNHGFGGAKDSDLVEYADVLLYPYHPEVVFLQTGSNDYVFGGLDEQDVMEEKTKMYDAFSEELPDTVFIVMSGLPLPGRSDLKEETDAVNVFIRSYCEEHENFYFIDADPVMYREDGSYRTEYFQSDMIHLNRAGHDVWTELMVEKLQEIYGE